MARLRISVLIDTYNHERFIEEAVQSVLAQDFPVADREILVVDDGSTDNTPDLLRKFGPQIRILRKPNGGQASAFNLGIPECTGEIVAFLDGDDWWTPAKLSRIVQVFATNANVGLVGHGIREVFSDGGEILQTLHEEQQFQVNSIESARLFRLRKAFLGTSRMAVRTSVLHQMGKVPETLRLQADEYIFTMAAILSQTIILKDPLTYYRLHSSNGFQVSSKEPVALRKKYQVLADLAKSLQAALAQRGVKKEVSEAILAAIQTESTLIRLAVDGGFPWETVFTEFQESRILYPNASTGKRILKLASLLPAFVMPPKAYYQIRNKVTSSRLYTHIREKWMPQSRLDHIDRQTSSRS